MSENFKGEIFMFAGNYAPRDSAFCQGQLLAITSYTALFSLIGTIYGGNGRVTFGLPDLAGRTPIGQGHGPGLPDVRLGERSGSETVSLSSNQIGHSHDVTMKVSGGPPDTSEPNENYLSNQQSGPFFSQESGGGTFVWGQSDSYNGGSVPHNNVQPYLALNYCIQLTGIYPSRN